MRKFVIPTILAALTLLGVSQIAKFTQGELVETQRARSESFNGDLIAIDPKKPLTASFMTSRTAVNRDFAFTLRNASNYNYDVELKANLDDPNVQSPEATGTVLGANSDTEITTQLPLAFDPKQAGGKRNSYETTLHFKLRTKVQVSKLLPAVEREVDLELPIRLILLSAEQIATAKVEVETDNLIFSANQKPELKIQLNLDNHSDETITGFYEAELLDSKGALVQPLKLKEAQVKPGEKLKLPITFKFSTPPANQLGVGKQTYSVRVKFRTALGTRDLVWEATGDKQLTIEVK